MPTPVPERPAFTDPSEIYQKLWIYTNYDCNLRCPYCVAKSSPETPRRAIAAETTGQLIDEASALGFEQIFFTGGEPFILDEVYALLAYSTRRLSTTVLTNAMLFNEKRLEQLSEINNDNLIVQVSLDGARPEHHDPYRGAGSWTRAVAGLQALLESGVQVRLSTTQTPANAAHLDELCAFHNSLGIPEKDHLIRPLARGGNSSEGVEVYRNTLAPELTVNLEGVYWHPLLTEPGGLVSEQIFPLASAVRLVQEQLAALQSISPAPLKTIT
jgi:MoaA/NifB/PqqE/SkfB family radical SAM enzyme